LFTGLSWKEWSKNDIIFGVIIPVIVVLVIVAFASIRSLIGPGSMESLGVVIGITMEITELTIIVAIPLMLGLVWNRWAGGASGFLMGTFYAIYWMGSLNRLEGGGIILLAYILSPMLIGFMAGALNKGSEDFKRMLISGLVATTIGGIMLLAIFQLSPSNVVTGVDAVLLNVLPRMLMGVIIAVVAKVFFWYGMGAHSKTNQ
jgi:hypothetical protein